MATYHLAENLLRLRTFYGYTQKYISQQLHISRQSYSNYERGTRFPDLDTAVRLAEFYSISLDCLILSDDPAKDQVQALSYSSKQRPGAWEPTGAYGKHTAVTPVGSRIFLDGPETKMHITYKELSSLTQHEIREYVRFKKQWEQSLSKGS